MSLTLSTVLRTSRHGKAWQEALNGRTGNRTPKTTKPHQPKQVGFVLSRADARSEYQSLEDGADDEVEDVADGDGDGGDEILKERQHDELLMSECGKSRA